MTESPKPPPRPAPRSAASMDPKHGAPPPPPMRHALKPAAPENASAAPEASSALRSGTGTAPMPPAVVIPPARRQPQPREELTREEARDTLAPSSFGSLGSRPNASAEPLAAPTGLRSARAPMPTLGELEGASATATLRPPGAVPPPPRALPMPTPSPEAVAERSAALETPLPGDARFAPLTPSPRVMSGAAPATPPAPASELDSTLDMAGSASKKAAQAELIEKTRHSDAGASRAAVPAPGLYIADEPLERRPKQASMVTVERKDWSRMRAGMLVLGALLLMAAGALVVLIFRRSEASSARQAAAGSASSVAPVAPPSCRLVAPPSRIGAIERSVPISALTSTDGNVELAIAETKTKAASFVYRAPSGDVERRDIASNEGSEITHVGAGPTTLVDRSRPELAFGQTLSPGLELGVGAAGVLRRGADGATGVVWPLPAGARVTAPRVVSLAGGHFVTLRQGGAEGQVLSGWLKPDGSAATELAPISGLPKSLGTPSATAFGSRALLLVAAREDKTAQFRIYAAEAALGELPAAARPLDAPAEGGGAIAPSLTELTSQRHLLQWTSGNVGQYQVHVRILDSALAPLGPPLLVSAKGANAGQGVVAGTPRGAASFFIQTTAGHDELWGVTLSCR